MDQRIFPAVPLKPCPVCGADPVSRSWFQTLPRTDGGAVILEIFDGITLDRVECSPLVCACCGYVQFFVDVEELQKKLNEAEEKRQRQNPLKW